MDAEHRVVTIDRHEWVLKSPAHHTEIGKAVDAAELERATQASKGVRTGDVHVHGDDTELVISFEAERKNSKRTIRDQIIEADDA